MLLKFLIATSLSFFSIGADIKIVAADIPPYSKKNPDGTGSGVIYEIVQELLKRVGQTQKVEFLPWIRAQNEVQKFPNMGVIPLARVAGREDKYQWLLHVLDDSYVLFVLKDSKLDVSSIEKVKHLRVGILRGSVGDYVLKEMGFTNILRFNDEIQNAKMLESNRIDLWAAPLSYVIRLKEKGVGAKEVKVGLTLMTLHEYLAVSKNVDSETATKWRKAFDSMKKDGTYREIMQKYGFEPLK